MPVGQGYTAHQIGNNTVYADPSVSKEQVVEMIQQKIFSPQQPSFNAIQPIDTSVRPARTGNLAGLSFAQGEGIRARRQQEAEAETNRRIEEKARQQAATQAGIESEKERAQEIKLEGLRAKNAAEAAKLREEATTGRTTATLGQRETESVRSQTGLSDRAKASTKQREDHFTRTQAFTERLAGDKTVSAQETAAARAFNTTLLQLLTPNEFGESIPIGQAYRQVRDTPLFAGLSPKMQKEIDDFYTTDFVFGSDGTLVPNVGVGPLDISSSSESAITAGTPPGPSSTAVPSVEVQTPGPRGPDRATSPLGLPPNFTVEDAKTIGRFLKGVSNKAIDVGDFINRTIDPEGRSATVSGRRD